jgi:hypothetical protein
VIFEFEDPWAARIHADEVAREIEHLIQTKQVLACDRLK